MADRDLEKKMLSVRQTRARGVIERSWQQAGHDCYAHLRKVEGRGDGTVLGEFWQLERYGPGTPLGAFLAQRDMTEIGNAIKSCRQHPA